VVDVVVVVVEVEVVVMLVDDDVVVDVVVVVVAGVAVVEVVEVGSAAPLDATEAQPAVTKASAIASAVIAGRRWPSTRGRVSRCRVASRS